MMGRLDEPGLKWWLTCFDRQGAGYPQIISGGRDFTWRTFPVQSMRIHGARRTAAARPPSRRGRDATCKATPKRMDLRPPGHHAFAERAAGIAFEQCSYPRHSICGTMARAG